VTRARMLALAGLPLVALPLALLLSGCAALIGPSPTPTTAPPTPASGIQGRVLIGPTCRLGSAAPDESATVSEPPGRGPSFDPDVTPEPPPSIDPDATDDPDPTPYPAACTKPYVATLAVTDALDDSTKARVTSGADGSFRVDLPPGDYVVVPGNGDPFPMAQPVDVTVVAGDYAPVEINYDTGIR
jgi:hypothetical protein